MAQYSSNLIGMGAGDYGASSARRKQARQNLIGMGGFSQQAARMSALDQMAGTSGMFYAGGNPAFDESSGRTLGGGMQPPRNTVGGMSPLPQPPRAGTPRMFYAGGNPDFSETFGGREPEFRIKRPAPIGTLPRRPPITVGGRGRPSPYDNIQVGSTISDRQLLDRTSPEFWTRLARLGNSSPEGRAWAEELARRQRALMAGRVEDMQIRPGDQGRARFGATFGTLRTTPPATGGGRAV